MSATTELEHRNFLASVSDVKPAERGNGMDASGYAILYGRRSLDLGGFVEEIAPGALGDGLADADVRALYSHDPAKLLGRTSSGTLQLKETQHGLAFLLTLPATGLGTDTAVLLRRGDLASMSFGFVVTEDDWDETETGGLLRVVRGLELHEISIVGCPAYPDAFVSL